MSSMPYTIVTNAPKVGWAPFLIAALYLYNFDPIDPNQRVLNTPPTDIHHEYDFIIVGAGSAGSVLAGRLTEVADWSVLLLEAGGDETVILDVPFLQRVLKKTNLDWQYKTEPSDTACLAMEGARCEWPRGKVLGGSSSINGMVYVRGNKKDYDHWESLGNPGWGYKDALHYFKKSEDVRIPELQNSPYHSTGGPLGVSQGSYETPLVPAFLEAMEELGYPTRDYNGEFQTGFMKTQVTTQDGQRCSAAKAFLRPARKRPNLQISMRSHVKRVLIDPVWKVAYGVEFVRDEKTYTIRARKEVILSAGAINSPQILMLSGVGPATDLLQLSIPVLKDLKVGYNLQDHVGANVITFSINQSVITGDKRMDVVDAVLDYTESNSGVLTLPSSEVLGNINTKYVNASDDWPDVQLGISSSYGINATGFSGESDPGLTKPSDSWSVYVCLNKCKSVGRLKLRSTDPFAYPVLTHNYFTDNTDLLSLIEGVKTAYSIGQTKALQKFGSTFTYTNPNCTQFPQYSDAYWECAIRYSTRSGYHPVGTCKMGPNWDPDAVVDNELRVYGILRLRVIDSSIMPTLVNGNTNAPSIMIGEKGADIVKKAWFTERPPVI